MSLKRPYFLSSILIILSVLSGLVLASSKVSAGDIIDNVNILVRTSCTLSGVGMNTHNATISPGTYNSSIGETTIRAFCNDGEGFGIYAIGYTNDTDGNNTLRSTNLTTPITISTGTGTSGNSSQWAMKLATQSSPAPAYPITIQNSFDSFHTVPDDYTLVAKRTAGTDIGASATGSTLTTTYQTYIASSQAAGTYVGKVKYVLVHPQLDLIPNSTMLDTGTNVCAKMKSLAANTNTSCNTLTSDIKAIRMASSLPNGFVPSDANTVSDPTLSRKPIYIFYDNTNNAGIMYFYSDGYQIVMNPDSSYLFRSNLALSDISAVASWDSSHVTTLRAAFIDNTALTNLNALSSWDTSQLEELYYTFGMNRSSITSGYRSQLSDISGLTAWDISNVSTIRAIFYNVTSLQDISPLMFWDVSGVGSMRCSFSGTSVVNLDALSNWDVSGVEDMYMLFGVAGTEYNNGVRSYLEDITGIANWDVSNVKDMSYMFQHADQLTDASAIVDWDVSSVTVSGSENLFSGMFLQSGATPVIFNLRPGTWNSDAEYIPSS